MFYSFQYQQVSFSYEYQVEYVQNGESVITAGDECLAVEPQTVPLGEYGFQTRLVLRNLSSADLFLHSAYPVCIRQLKLGTTPSAEWMIMNQGRHKNDIPGVFRAGVRDEAFRDAADRLSEQGEFLDSAPEKDVELQGDQISILYAQSCCLSLYFVSTGTQLTEISIPLDPAGNVGSIRVGGVFDCRLSPGGSICTEWAAADCRPDPFMVMDSYSDGLACSMHARTAKKRPGIYSTWSYYGTDIDEDNVLLNLRCIADKGLPFDCFQIDAGWSGLYGDWEANEKFPHGMAYIAKKIRQQGLMAGIWTCPLIVHPQSSLVQNHPDWMLRHTDGSHCLFHGSHDYYVLDCTHPQVLEWIEDLYRRLTSWGFQYHKLDFSRAFVLQTDAVYHDPYRTPVQAYVKAMQAVRSGIGSKGYFVVCGGLFDPLIGICDAQRTGSDVLSCWRSPTTGKMKVPVTMKQNIMRSFMNHWYHCDPDSLMVRRKSVDDSPRKLRLGSLTDDEAITFTANQYFSGGIVCSTEPLNEIDDDRLYLLRHVMPTVPAKTRPYSLFDGERFVRLIDVCVENGWHTVCAVNWGEEPEELELTIEDALLETDKTSASSATGYYAASFFGKKVYVNVLSGQRCSFGKLAPHSTEIIKLAPMNVPQVIQSDAHFSMGGEVTLSTEPDGRVLFEMENPYPVELHYTVALPDGRRAKLTVPGRSAVRKWL